MNNFLHDIPNKMYMSKMANKATCVCCCLCMCVTVCVAVCCCVSLCCCVSMCVTICCCVSLCYCVSLCVAVCHYMCRCVSLCVTVYHYLLLCVAVYHYVSLCVCVCARVRACARVCACVSQVQRLCLPVPGLSPVGPDWTSEATESFKSLVATGQSPIRLYMIVVERNGGSLSVRLVDTSGDDVNGKDLGTQLIAMGMAASKRKQGQCHQFDKQGFMQDTLSNYCHSHMFWWTYANTHVTPFTLTFKE